MEEFLKKGRSFDYIRRVLASFAEIYNYDVVMNAVEMKDFSEDCFSKIFHEDILNGEHTYCYSMYGTHSMLWLADMIAMSARIVEAFGIRHYVISVSNSVEDTSALFQYLDCLDIDYQDQLMESADDKILFELFILDEEEKKHLLLQGYSFEQGFMIQGSYETILNHCMDDLHLDEKMLDVVVMSETSLEQEHGLYLVQELRLNGFKTEFLFHQDVEFVKEYCPSKYVIRLKEDDISRSEVELMDLYTEEKERIKEMDLIGHLDINF